MRKNELGGSLFIRAAPQKYETLSDDLAMGAKNYAAVEAASDFLSFLEVSPLGDFASLSARRSCNLKPARLCDSHSGEGG